MTTKEAFDVINGAEIMALNVPIRKLQLAIVSLMTAAKRAMRYDKQIIDGELVEVVHCKDCARRKNGFCTIRKDSWGATLLVGDHDFCSDAERRNHGK